ncbi:MAG: hypothetical protein AAF519_11610 [Bacteroidota bacterium]
MKSLKFTLSVLMLFALSGVMSCSDDDDGPTVSERQLELLQGVWSVSQDDDVTFQNTNAPGDWSAFSITFNMNNTVTVSGQPTDVDVDLFELSSFEISGDQVQSFTLIFNGQDGEQATVNITDSEMLFSFSITANDDKLGARTAAVTGLWELSLSKN